MTHYGLLCFAVVSYVIQQCHSASTSIGEDSTLPSLKKEVEDNSRYKTLEANATMLKLLVSDKNGVSRTEVFDMLHSRDDNQEHIDLPPFPEDTEDAKADVPLEPKNQAELLQDPEEVVYRDSMERTEWKGGSRSAAAFLMVVVVCAIVLVAYAALIAWRRMYLQRNGLKHEQLKNEPNIEETIDM